MTVSLGRRRILVFCFSMGLAAAVGYACWPRRHEAIFEGIRVRGSDVFVKQIEAALVLLRERSPAEFGVVRRHIEYIDEAKRSGMWADADPPTLDLSSKTANYSVTWCAGSIAHDAYHSKLYHEYRREHGEPVPDSAWRGKAREFECIQFQMSVLEKLGAPDFELKHLNGQDGGHYDLDGDGEETWNDYRMRDW